MSTGLLVLAAFGFIVCYAIIAATMAAVLEHVLGWDPDGTKAAGCMQWYNEEINAGRWALRHAVKGTRSERS